LRRGDEILKTLMLSMTNSEVALDGESSAVKERKIVFTPGGLVRIEVIIYYK
jgi:hypothetical protein